MEWLSANWFWILIFLFFIWMHMGGHGCHGGHKHGSHQQPQKGDDPGKPEHHHSHSL